MKLNSDFRTRIMKKYFKNETWRKIIRTINKNAALEENATKLFFVREFTTISRESDSYMILNMRSVFTFNQNQKKSRSVESISSFNSIHDRQNDMNLIYHVNKSTEEKRLCISSKCVANILVVAHERK
jgi:hypothetical protein